MYDKAVDSGQVRELSARHLGRAGIRGGILGGTLDAGIGAGQDYFAGASRSKILANAGSNFTVASLEGAFVGTAMAINPVVGGVALVLVYLFERNTGKKLRDKIKYTLNSLE